jgi:uncharacterized protein with HEPN domain
MKQKVKKLLSDVQVYGLEALSFVHGHDFESFQHDKLVRAAVERDLTVVGEAIRQARELDAEAVAKIADFQKIIGLRNILVHAYSSIELGLLWEIVTENLPKLLADVERLLSEAETNGQSPKI